MSEKKCNSCKKPLINVESKIVILSTYIIGTSIYGTIELVKKLISLF
jgi:hypothetical protein